MVKWKTNKLSFFIFIISLFFVISLFFDFNVSVIIEYAKSQKNNFDYFYANNKFSTIFTFFSLYVFFTAVSLPSITILTIIAGSLFGFFIGVLTVSFASAFGATFIFLLSRFVILKRLNKRIESFKILSRFSEGIRVYGVAYLFFIRLVKAFPFFLVNFFMGIMPIKISTFFLITQAGMLLRIITYVYFGTQIIKINTLSKLISPEIVFSLFLIVSLPVFSRKLANFVQNYLKNSDR